MCIVNNRQAREVGIIVENRTTDLQKNTSHKRHQVDIDGALGFENDAMLARYVRDQGVTDSHAKLLFLEIKKFLILSAMLDQELSPSEEQDKMWHHFIIHTMDYASFCEKYLGRFIHHLPCTGTRPDHACETKEAARKLFGEINEELWPKPSGAARCCKPYC